MICRHHGEIERRFIIINSWGDLFCGLCQKEFIREERRRAREQQKEALSDDYIRSLICRGTNLQKRDIPPELIEIKRVALRIKTKKIYTDGYGRFRDCLLRCKKHGKQFHEGIIKSGISPSGRQTYKCKACMKELHKRHYAANKETISAKQKIYKQHKRSLRDVNNQHNRLTES